MSFSQMLKRHLCVLFVGALCIALAHAQDSDYVDRSNLSFRFHYIAHDETTPVSAVVEKLEEDYNFAIEDEDNPHPAIFYLSSGSNPIIVKVNLPGDNREDFDKVLLPELYQRNAHEVNQETDLDMWNNLFDEVNLVDEDNRLNFQSSYFSFYVNPQFWRVKNNEKLIATLFMGLDASNIAGGRVTWTVYEPRYSKLNYLPGKPFGEMNVSDINDKITISEIEN